MYKFKSPKCPKCGSNLYYGAAQTTQDKIVVPVLCKCGWSGAIGSMRKVSIDGNTIGEIKEKMIKRMEEEVVAEAERILEEGE